MKSRRIFVILVLGLLVTPVLAESESQIVDEESFFKKSNNISPFDPAQGDWIVRRESLHGQKQAFITSQQNILKWGALSTNVVVPSSDNSEETYSGTIIPLYSSGKEDFEGSFPGSYWFVGDNNPSSGNVYWDDVSCKSNYGSWSGWCADIGGPTNCTEYVDNMDAYMYVECDYYGTTSSGTNKLYYDRWVQVEDGWDYFHYKIQGYASNPGHGVDGTPDAEFTFTLDGDSADWEGLVITLGSSFDSCWYLRITFYFHSDGSVHSDEGAYLDEIEFNNRSDTSIYPISGGFPATFSPPQLVSSGCYVQPTTINPGGRLTVYYRINNPNSGNLTVGLGCSIRKNGTDTWISDPDDDVYKSCPPGESTQTRYFDVQSDAASGSYDVAWGLHQDFVLPMYDYLDKTNQFDVVRADLALTSLTVSPSTITTRAFTACSFNIVNNGPTALSSEGIMVDYYLSTNTTFGDGDDVKIGDTGFTVSIASGGTYTINLNSTGLNNMVRFWPVDQPGGNYYVFATVKISDGTPVDPTSGNNYDRTDSTIFYNPPIPNIRIEPLTLDFESLVATVGGTATDSGESISYTALVTASVNDFNDIDSSYYYYYFDKKKPLVLDVNQIALKRALWSTQTLLQGRFEKFGISDADLEPWPIAGWTLANTPVATKLEENIDQLVTDILDDEAADFVSPVFIGDDGGPVIITSTIFVGFNENVDVDQAEAILSELEVDAVVEPNYANMKGVYRLSDVGQNGFEVLQKANSLAELLEVKFAEPDMIITVDSLFVPNDPGFSQCWGIHNTGQSGGTPDMDMDGPEAWDLSTGDSSIIIVVFDNGVQQDHPDIHQIAGADFTGEGGGGGPVNECDDHGTAVAGCISATINNNLGTVGIAPNCVVASARVSVSNIPCDGRGTFMWSWIVNALDWAETIGARVTNNSNSYDSTSSLLTTKYAQTRDNGMVHFASAGNDYGGPVSYPASLPTVNAVAAVDRNGDLANFSNFGTGLTFSAPGQSIYTTDRTGSDGYSSGDYTTINGTSFASPYTAGVAALVLSVNPNLDTAAVEQILQQSAVDLGSSGYDTTFGWGFVNAFEAIKQASEAQDFIIYNDGTSTLTVSGITKEGGSTWLGFTPVPPFDVTVGNSQAVTVSVDPTGLSPDTYSDRLLVYSNDPDENPYPGGVYVNLTITCVSTTIEQPPQDITICEGQDAVFDIVATGSEPLQYQWKKDGSNVGIDSSELTLYNMQLANDGSEIWCEVTNACGSVVVSTSAFLTVYPWPTVTVNPNPDQLNAAWVLDGPNGYTYSSNGDETIANLEFGNYTITWSTMPSWNTPLPNPDIKNLSVGNSINFIGNYQLIADLNNDYFVDYEDLAILVSYWLTFEPSINMNGDDFIDLLDFAVLAEHWLEGVQ